MNPPATNRVALAVVTAIFFMWGFLTSLNDVLIPHFKALFELNYTRSMLIQFTFFGAYFAMSMPAARLVARLGYKHSIVLGLVIAGVGALIFLPAASIRSYELFLFALFVLASGITLLQVSANPYVSMLGAESTASSRLTLAQALNSLGHTLGPKLGGIFILSVAVIGADVLATMSPEAQAAYRAAEAAAVQGPYLFLALVLFGLAIALYLFRLPPLSEATERADDAHHSYAEALRHRNLRYGVVGIFAYVGAEVAIGSFLINYISQADVGAMSEEAAATYVSLYWGGAMVGRFGGSLLLQAVPARRVLSAFAAFAVLLLIGTMTTHGALALWSVVAIGLFNSVMFPSLFTLGIEGLGPLTPKGSGLLIMAIVGGAIVPVLQGMLADRIGIKLAFVVPVLCYLYIIWYGWRGARQPAAAGAA